MIARALDRPVSERHSLRRRASLLLICAAAIPLHAEPPRHLFLDPAMVLRSENAALHVNPPEQRELVIRPDRPWEQLMISFFLTVREEQGKLRMWYICRDKANHP